MSKRAHRVLTALLAVSLVGGGALGHGGVIPPIPAGPYNGPGDTPPAPRGPSAPAGPSAPTAPAAPSGPSVPGPGTGAPGGGPRGPGTGGAPRGGVATGESDPYGFATWEAWWHFNKDPFLEIKRAITQSVRTSGADDSFAAAGSGIPPSDLVSSGLVRTRIVPALFQLLEVDRANDVMTGALIALARIGEPDGVPEGSSAIPRFVRALGDPNQEVAETAALALGILRSEAVTAPLTDLLEGGERGKALVGGKDVDTRTRAFAAFGLGLAAERATDNRTRQLVARSLIAALEERKANREVQVAAVLALSLDRIDAEAVESTSAPWISRQTVVRKLIEVFSDPDRNHLVRAHAATAIGRLARDAPPALRMESVDLFVLALKKSSRLENEVVNSCIQALGTLADTSPSPSDRAARAALVRALDESDPQARAFAMISLAEVGGRGARDGAGESAEIECRSVLVNEILRGKSTSKPWAVIALGLHERRRTDRGGQPSENARQVLLDWLAAARGRNEIGSGSLAVGLCRESRAAKILVSKLSDTNDDTGQGYVALALGMIGHVEAVPALRSVVQAARYRPTLLEQAAEALALLGDRENSPALARQVGEARGAAAQAALAGALGFIGDARSVEPLLALIARKDLSGSARGLAAAALGRVADESPLPWHVSISCGLNYRAATVSLFAGDGTGLLEIL